MNKWLQSAKKIGFTEAVFLDIHTLHPMDSIREMCAEDKCHAYGKNWTCPPYCGSLEECDKKIHSYRHGLLLQTVGKLEKIIDTKAYERTEKLHLKHFLELADRIRKEYPDALCLGSGGCRICKICAWPQQCRFPERAYSSMEGYGLFVTQVCRDNGIPYYHGEKTITYSACILF